MDAVLEALSVPGRLRAWLVGVAALRLLSVYLGYVQPFTLQRAVFARASKEFSSLTARTFAVWTSATCAVTLMTAFHLDSAPLVDTCIATFAIANTFFAAELLIYKTVTVRTITAPFFFASACPGSGWAGVGAARARPARTRRGTPTSTPRAPQRRPRRGCCCTAAARSAAGSRGGARRRRATRPRRRHRRRRRPRSRRDTA